MPDPEKTKTENAINRKLDALRAAIERIPVKVPIAREIAMSLEEAWKEKDEPQ